MTELRWRHECKYWISWQQYHQLRTRLAALTTPDPHAGPSREYMVRSLYLDTFRGDHAQEKLAGLERRAKYRVRIYDPLQDWARLEVKHRRGNLVAKASTKLTRGEVEQLLSGTLAVDRDAPSCLAQVDRAVRHRAARHACIVQYTREAYTFGPGNVRVTFDKHLRTSPWSGNLFDPALPLLPIALSADLILEVKFDGFLPAVIRRLLPRTLAGQAAISKYILCRPRTHRWEEGS